MNNELHFSSASDLWSTPQHLFDSLNGIFNFTLDVCASSENAKCASYYTEEQDGLAQEWTGVCWMNPPYGKTIGQWMDKALSSSINNNATVVCLVPARTDTKWWTQYAIHGEIYFIVGRLKFGNQPNAAPFPSAIVVFRPKIENIIKCYKL